MRRECKQASAKALLGRWHSLPGTAHIRIPSDDCEQMRALKESMWLLAEMWCSSPEMHSRAIAGLRTMMLVLLGCLFPEDIKTHRKDNDLELLLATLLTIQGIVQLRSRRTTRWAQKIIRLCTPMISMMLLAEHHPAAIATGLKYVKSSLENCHGHDQAALYVMFSEDTTYIGKALLERAHAALGVKARIMEHLSGILRVYRRAQQQWFVISGQKGRSAAQACVRLACLVAQVQGYVRRSRGYQHVDRLLHRFRLPGRQTTCFKVPDERSLNIARRIVRQAAKSLANKHGEVLLPWVLSKVRFVGVAAKRYTDRRNIVAAAKSIDIMQVCTTNPFMLEGLQRAEEVKLLHGNWGLQDKQAGSGQLQALHVELLNWCHQKHVPRPARLDGLKTLRQACQERSLEPQGHAPVGEQSYIQQMQADDHEILLQDDKDRKRTWGMPFIVMSALLVLLVLRDGTRWHPTDMTPDQLSALVYGMSIFALPSFLRKGAVTAKSMVVSFYHAPWRKAWRLAGRAIQIIVQATFPGFAVWNLQTAVPQFCEAFDQLRSSTNPCRCDKCGAAKYPSTLLVADAAQMYEQIDTTKVLLAFDRAAERLRLRKGLTTVTVKRQRKLLGWTGGQSATRSGKFVVFTTAQLRKMLWASCALRFATLGNLVVRATGVMIGGLLSMIAAVGLLCQEEQVAKESQEFRRLYLPNGWDMIHAFFAMRYVDDLLIYSVTFEISPEALEQTWTDLVFRVDPVSGRIAWAPKNPNRDWILGKAAKKKERYIPYLDRLQCPFGLIRGMLIGRATRLRHMGLSPNICSEQSCWKNCKNSS
ncbi:unnamed protein product [Symbiodinium sp. CCMP2592]|nr:unnamed protein product [Symbiodinium sp. CCMP2592]